MDTELMSFLTTGGCFKCKVVFEVNLHLDPDVTTYPCEECGAVALGYALPDVKGPGGHNSPGPGAG